MINSPHSSVTEMEAFPNIGNCIEMDQNGLDSGVTEGILMPLIQDVVANVSKYSLGEFCRGSC